MFFLLIISFSKLKKFSMSRVSLTQNTSCSYLQTYNNIIVFFENAIQDPKRLFIGRNLKTVVQHAMQALIRKPKNFVTETKALYKTTEERHT